MPEPRPAALLALDFDGVICNSLPEVLNVALAAYRVLRPSSTLHEQLQEPRGPLYERFRELMPLGNRAEDFGVALHVLDEGLPVADQASYDRAMHSLPTSFLEEYHREFYRQRCRLRERDRRAWLELHLPYEAFVTALERRPPRLRLAIATSKDRESVSALLAHFGLAELFAPEWILDKETGKDKSIHLGLLARRTGLSPTRITFVDDKVNHLLKVAPLGVRPVLAAWGYNTERERRLARSHGFPVAEIDDAATLLFDI